MLERKPSLTDQAKTYIKERIISDEFEGERIPSETELANELGVSRTTIRDALSRLENEGVVYRKQGSGTYVNKVGLQIKTRLEEIWSYEAVLRAHGYTPATRILSVERQAANSEMVEDLRVSPGEILLTVHKLFLENDEPVILTINQVPARLLNKAVDKQAWAEPIYDFMLEHARQRLSYYLSEIVPVVAAPAVARYLQVKPGKPLISFAEIGYNDESEPILRAKSFFRDDLLRLRLIRRQV